MLPKFAHLIQATSRAAATAHNHALRNVLGQGSSSSTAGGVGAGVNGWSGAGSSSWGGYGAGAGGAKYNTGSRFYNSYNNASRSLTQANGTTANDSGSTSHDDTDEHERSGERVPLRERITYHRPLASPRTRDPNNRARARARSSSLSIDTAAREARGETLGVLRSVQFRQARAQHTEAAPNGQSEDVDELAAPTPPGSPRVRARRNSTSSLSASDSEFIPDLDFASQAQAIDSTAPETPQSTLPPSPPSPSNDNPTTDIDLGESTNYYTSPSHTSTDPTLAALAAARFSGSFPTALSAVAHLHSTHPSPTLTHYTAALSTLLATRPAGTPLTELVETYNALLARGLTPDVRTYRLMIMGLCERDREVHQLVKTLERRVRRRALLGVAPLHPAHADEGTYLAHLHREDNGASALTLFTAVSRLTSAPLGRNVYSKLLRSCAYKGDVDAALRVFAHVERARNVRPDAACYMWLMETYVRAGDVEGAEEVFKEFNKACKDGRVFWDGDREFSSSPKRAESALAEEFESDNESVAESDVESVAGGSLHLSDPELPQFHSPKTIPSTPLRTGKALGAQMLIYNAMLSAYFSNPTHTHTQPQPLKALTLLEHMLSSSPLGSSYPATSPPAPSPSTYTTLISGFIRIGDWESALRWFERLLEQGGRAGHPLVACEAPVRPARDAWAVVVEGLVGEVCRICDAAVNVNTSASADSPTSGLVNPHHAQAAHKHLTTLNRLFARLVRDAPADGLVIRALDRVLVFAANVRYLETFPDVGEGEVDAIVGMLMGGANPVVNTVVNTVGGVEREGMDKREGTKGRAGVLAKVQAQDEVYNPHLDTVNMHAKRLLDVLVRRGEYGRAIRVFEEWVGVEKGYIYANANANGNKVDVDNGDNTGAVAGVVSRKAGTRQAENMRGLRMFVRNMVPRLLYRSEGVTLDEARAVARVCKSVGFLPHNVDAVYVLRAFYEAVEGGREGKEGKGVGMKRDEWAVLFNYAVSYIAGPYAGVQGHANASASDADADADVDGYGIRTRSPVAPPLTLTLPDGTTPHSIQTFLRAVARTHVDPYILEGKSFRKAVRAMVQHEGMSGEEVEAWFVRLGEELVEEGEKMGKMDGEEAQEVREMAEGWVFRGRQAVQANATLDGAGDNAIAAADAAKAEDANAAQVQSDVSASASDADNSAPTTGATTPPTPSSAPPAPAVDIPKIDVYQARFIDEWYPVNPHVPLATAHARYLAGAARNIYPPPDTIARLIGGFGRARDTRTVHALYADAQRVLATIDDPRVHARAWYAVEDQMVIGLAHAGDMQKACVHRARILEQGIAPSSDAYGALIAGVEETTDDSANAVAFWTESQQRGVVPSIFLYNTIISKLSKARKADYALDLFAQMKAQGVRPTSVTYGAIVAACCRVGDAGSAEMLFEEMRRQGNFKPRIPPYNTMVQFYVLTRPDRERALRYYNMMLEAGIRPSYYTYKLLLDCYGTIEPVDLNAMEGVFAQLVADPHVPVSNVHWAALIHAYGCVQKDLPKALAIFDSIATHPSTTSQSQSQSRSRSTQQQQQLPDSVVYEALFNVLVTLREPALVNVYLARMKAEGVPMTAYVANFLIRAHASCGGDIESARALFEGMEDPAPGAKAPNNHAPHANASGSGAGAGAVRRVGTTDGVVYREPSTWEAMVRAELGCGNKDAAIALLERLQTRGYPPAVYSRIRGIMHDDASASPWSS